MVVPRFPLGQEAANVVSLPLLKPQNVSKKRLFNSSRIFHGGGIS